MKKKTYLVIGLVIIILFGLGCVGNKPPQSGKDKEELPVTTAIPTVVPSTIQETSSTAPYVSGCQKSSSNLYGGINGNENFPPKGTEISQELTKYYGRLTATGVCGTYQYISGWWFNEAEMGRLPFKSIAYGVSPYDTDEGSDIQEPIVPVPESSTLILTTLGIFTVIMLKKYKQ